MKNIHFLRIPDYIKSELARIKSRYIVVATTTTVNQPVNWPNYILPNRDAGVYARRNLDGYDIVHRDRPKETKTVWWRTPNFGDPDKGYHDNYRDYEAYQRTHVAPREWEFAASIIREIGDKVLVKISVDVILDRNAANFNDDLFFALNLLQESFRDSHVFAFDTTDEEFARMTVVGWEIFPEGSLQRAITRVTGQVKNVTPEKKQRIEQRAIFIGSLKPKEYIVGTGMNRRYFGAKFKDDLVVFENIEYGNALYVLFGNWEELSQMSRIDILQRPESDFKRFSHKKGWEKAVRDYIRSKK